MYGSLTMDGLTHHGIYSIPNVTINQPKMFSVCVHGATNGLLGILVL